MEDKSTTDQSLSKMHIEENGNENENKEYKEYNNDMSKLDTMFNVLTKDETILSSEEITQKGNFSKLFEGFESGKIRIDEETINQYS